MGNIFRRTTEKKAIKVDSANTNTRDCISPRGASGLRRLGFKVKLDRLVFCGEGEASEASVQPPQGDDDGEGGVVVNEDNFWMHVNGGKHYNDVARCCMDVAQDTMMETCGCRWVECTKGRVLCGGEERKDVLVVIPGKGRVDAGIMARSLLMKNGMRVGSVINIGERAWEEGWGVIMLAPNFSGSFQSGVAMATVKGQWEEVVMPLVRDSKGGTADVGRRKIHILAHSAGGAQVVECLRDCADGGAMGWLGKLCFTDSTHSLRQVSLTVRGRSGKKSKARIGLCVEHDYCLMTNLLPLSCCNHFSHLAGFQRG